MRLREHKITKPVSEYLDSEGFTQLYPPQSDCIREGLLEGTSLLVSAPTASGKTLIAIMAMISYLSKNSGKIIYLSPLRALAAEKLTEFKKLEKMNFGRKIQVAMSTGDFDNSGKNLANSNVLILTNEKMDSIIRHGVDWIDDIGLVIADEIHLIGDDSRGATLEMVLTRLKLLDAGPQIVGLSATITNARDIADWLGCKLIKSDWRPVPLSEGVSDTGTVMMDDGTTFKFKSSIRGSAVDLGVQSVIDGGQSLIFAETRARSKALATKAADVVVKHLQRNDITELEKISKKILVDNEQTSLVKTLAFLINKGVAFHHAGLNQNCRQAIETEFRRGAIKLLTSTPTLAAGVNLPARRVIISSVKRYDPKLGINKPISILEYKQLCGRAGRPQFDDRGEAITVGNESAEDITDVYINGEPESIESKITDEISLRTHVLSVIVTRPDIKTKDIQGFFLHTLGGMQSTKSSIKFAIDMSLQFLARKDMIVIKDERHTATKLGQKTSMLYIDPRTAADFRHAIEHTSKKRRHTFGFLHLISTCEEFFPRFSLRNKDYNIANLVIENKAAEMLEPVLEHGCSRSLLALESWINEYSELYLSDTLGIESGDMHRMVESGERLAYCLREIARVIKREDLLEELGQLRLRIIYGIREELLDLVRIKGIGRIRARILYNNGIKNRSDLAEIPVERLSRIDKIGIVLANNIKAELRKNER